MLIVCTQDRAVRDYANEARSGARDWLPLVECSMGDQSVATQEIRTALGTLGPNDLLCLSAHGNARVFGDAESKAADWTWRYDELATMLKDVNPDFRGVILLSICSPESEEIKAAAGTLAVALEREGACKGAWIYGYIWSTPVDAPFPAPSKLDHQADLTHVHVS